MMISYQKNKGRVTHCIYIIPGRSNQDCLTSVRAEGLAGNMYIWIGCGTGRSAISPLMAVAD
jgi:hypothetical protein